MLMASTMMVVAMFEMLMHLNPFSLMHFQYLVNAMDLVMMLVYFEYLARIVKGNGVKIVFLLLLKDNKYEEFRSLPLSPFLSHTM